jgi:dihydroneopterin triphosphate diphosphatase
LADLRADCVAVYVYRRRPDGGLDFLQIRRTEDSLEHGAVWAVVYGGIEAGETAVQTALRELDEETGLRPHAMFQVEYLESFYFRQRDVVMLMPVFAVEVTGEPSIRLDADHDAYRWVPYEARDEQFLWRTQREAVDVIHQHLERPGQALPLLQIPLD